MQWKWSVEVAYWEEAHSRDYVTETDYTKWTSVELLPRGQSQLETWSIRNVHC